MDTTRPDAPAHDVAAEPDRISAKLVVGAAVVLTLVAVVAGALMVALFWGFDRRAERRDERTVEAAGLEERVAAPPPLPRLQIHAVRHWKDFQSAERARLDSYGWMDRTTGAVHIPIERAIDLIAERGVGPLPQAPVAIPAPAATPPAAAPERRP